MSCLGCEKWEFTELVTFCLGVGVENWNGVKIQNPVNHSIYRVLLCFDVVVCGEGGIRTPGGLTLNGFQDRRNRPLCHLSEDKSTSIFLFCKRITGLYIFFFLLRLQFRRKDQHTKGNPIYFTVRCKRDFTHTNNLFWGFVGQQYILVVKYKIAVTFHH